MAVTATIGAQWGDEGKGKIVDVLSEHTDLVVRFHGGNNAGHTIINKFGTFPLHLIPSGVFNPKVTLCITNGVVLDLAVLCDEISMLESAGISLKNRLYISPRSHLILPYHKLLDAIYEKEKDSSKTGTTGRGIGPAYADKVSYQGIRLVDLLDKKQFSDKLRMQLKIKNKILLAFGANPLDQAQIEEQWFGYRSQLLSYIKEPFAVIQTAVANKKRILLEGAQGVFLDNDWGTYPYVTASTVLPGGANAAAGIKVQDIDRVIGIVKAYTTRVGQGPFPSELLTDEGERLRTAGKEFGTTTGRPRRCGWFDAKLIAFATQISGITDIALTKLDVFDGFEEIRLCTSYTYKGKKVEYVDGDAVFLKNIEPEYITLKGWKGSIRGMTSYASLPVEAKEYIKSIEQHTGCQVSYVSTGPAREEIITR